MFWSCKHDWEIKDKTIMKSIAEQQKELGLAKVSIPAVRYGGDDPFLAIFRKKVIIIMSCKKCGKLKKFVESNPL